MGDSARTAAFRAGAALLLVAAILLGTTATDSLVPEARRAGAGEEVGRAGFAYLTGVRTFAAAVLWNRLEPVFHEYYGGVPLTEQIYMLPTVRMTVALDPQLQQPYFVAAWILAQRGEVDEGLELARHGVEANPRSGLLRANYAQILWLIADDVDAAEEQTRAALAPDIEWLDLIEQYQGYVVFRDVLRAAGDQGLAERVAREAQLIDEEIHRLGLDTGDDHDH